MRRCPDAATIQQGIDTVPLGTTHCLGGDDDRPEHLQGAQINEVRPIALRVQAAHHDDHGRGRLGADPLHRSGRGIVRDEESRIALDGRGGGRGRNDGASAPAHAAEANGCARTIARLMIPGTTETSAIADPNTPTGCSRPSVMRSNSDTGRTRRAVCVAPGGGVLQRTSYAESKSRGDEAAAELMQRCATSKFVVAGYSQGAQIGNDLAVNIACPGPGAVRSRR